MELTIRTVNCDGNFNLIVVFISLIHHSIYISGEDELHISAIFLKFKLCLQLRFSARYSDRLELGVMNSLGAVYT